MSLDKYYYLVGSLPALSLERPPPLTSESFLEACGGQLSPARLGRLQAVGLVPVGFGPPGSFERRWQAWETYLRNLLVWRRCHHVGCDQAHQWLRPESDVFPLLVRQVDEAITEDSPLECERRLDQLRWQALDHLTVGHSFDFEVLVAYRLRLLLVEKWRDHDTERGEAAFAELTEGLVGQALA